MTTLIENNEPNLDKPTINYSEEDKVLARKLPMHCEAGKSNGITHIQRKLRVGYNRGSYILDSALDQKVVERDKEKDWLFCLPKIK
mgnify:CR=1 FL=1